MANDGDGVQAVRFLIQITLLCLSLAAAAAEDSGVQAKEWLDRMVDAVKTLNYEGTFIYAHQGQLESMHIVHSADAAGEHERLVSLNGAAREIIRDDNVLTCFLPDSRSVVVEKSRPRKYIPEGLLNLGENLQRYYRFQMLDKDRVAGRSAQVIAIKPRDRYRYGYRLWLDRESAMLLKSDLIDAEGRALEQMMFTRLELRDHIPETLLKPANSGQGYRWFRAKDKPAKGEHHETHRWEATRLPEGFMMSMQAEHPLPTSVMPVEHMVFTDGLSSVSVYIEKPQQSERMLDGTSRMGAVNAYGTVVGGHQVTVVGEVPEATVRMIGESVRRVPAEEE